MTHGPDPHAETGQPKEIELRALVAVLRRQIRVILLSGAVIFGAAVLFLAVAPRIYTASTLILVDPDQRGILDDGQALPRSSGRENAKVDSEVEILRSDAVALAVIDRLGLAGDPEFGTRRGLAESLAMAVGIANAAPPDAQAARARTLERFKAARSVRRKGLTYLISVSARSRSPRKAAELANRLAEVYIAQQVEAKVAASLSARDILREQIATAERALEGYEARFDTFIAENIDSLQQAANSREISALQARLQEVERRREQAESLQRQVRQLAEREQWDSLEESLDDPQLARLIGLRRAYLGQMDDAGQADPAAARELQRELARIDAELRARTEAALSETGALMRALGDEMAGLRQELRRSVLSSELSPRMLTGLYALQQDAEIAREQYQNLLSRLRKLETQAQVQMADARVVSPAIAPVHPSFPDRNIVLLAALAASLGVGVSLAFLKEYYIGGVTAPRQLAELTRTETAAVIPAAPETNASRLSIADRVVDAPLSGYSESFRQLRAALDQALRRAEHVRAEHASAPESGRVALFTSARPDEGKTTSALALARTYALSGSRTLLIDADLRKPSVHRHLGHEPQKGFVDFLLGQADAEMSGSFYARDPASPLAVIMGAARSDFPTDQLLASPRFRNLLEQARQVYDMIIIDSPPLLPVVDARYIAPCSDALVLMVKWAATGQGDIRRAQAMLAEAARPDTPLLPVLGQVPEGPGSRARYGDYSGYASG